MKSLASLLCLASILPACRTGNDCGEVRMYDPAADRCVCRPEYTEVGDNCIPNDEVDAGPDAVVDAPRVDGMVDMCASPDECPEADNAMATCEAMVCGLECDEDWGDCDGDATNGCETDLTSSEAHCGTCENACAPDQLCFERACESEPMLDWGRSYGDVSTEQAYGVAIGSSGTTYVVSKYDSNFPPTVGERTLEDGGMVVIALSPTGDVVSVFEDGGDASVFPLDLAVDSAENVFVVGSFSGDGEFGGDEQLSGGGSDAFAVSYESDGSHRWSWTTRAADSQSFTDVAVDESGFVTVSGYFSGNATFGPFPALNEMSNGASDGVLVSYSNTGSTRWVETYGDSENDFLAATASPTGVVYAGGTFAGDIQLDDDVTRSSTGNTNAFVFGATTSGAYTWDSVPANSDASVVSRVAARTSGVVALGQFVGTVRFGDEELSSVGATADLFVAAFDLDGEVLWAERIGGTGDVFPIVGLAVGDDDAVYVTGSFNGRVGVGGTSVLSDLGDDAFVVGFDQSGSLRWIRAFGGAENQEPRDITTAPGRLVVTGYFSGEMDVAALNSTGGDDAFVLSFRTR